MKRKTLAPSPFVSIPDAALIAKVHVKTIYLLVRAGIIPSYGRPRTLRVKLSDVLPLWLPTPSKKSIKSEAAARALANNIRWAERELNKARALYASELEKQAEASKCA